MAPHWAAVAAVCLSLSVVAARPLSVAALRGSAASDMAELHAGKHLLLRIFIMQPYLVSGSSCPLGTSDAQQCFTPQWQSCMMMTNRAARSNIAFILST